LGSPSENFKGYVEADATQRARYIPNHALFLMHGLADLSVPYTHGVALAKSLAEAGILFKYHVCNYFLRSFARKPLGDLLITHTAFVYHFKRTQAYYYFFNKAMLRANFCIGRA
jgi:dipeptidyl aminopeptidase/acylaminoacyl peptidase